MVKLKNLHTYRDATGRFRAYVRRSGQKRIPIPGKLGSRGFMAAYHAAMEAKLPILPPKPREKEVYGPGNYIYFIKAHSNIKIGTTKHPHKRAAPELRRFIAGARALREQAGANAPNFLATALEKIKE
jgi:hypothetical protein